MARILSRTKCLRSVSFTIALMLAAGATSQTVAQATDTPFTPFSTMEQLNQVRTNQTLERDFIRSKFQANEYEIQLLRIALCQSTSPDIRAFAHNTLDKQLILDQMLYAFVRSLKIRSPKHISHHYQLQLDHIEQDNGTAFNAAFLLTLRHAYRNDQQDYRHQSGISQDPGIKLTLQQGLRFYKNRLAALYVLIHAHHITKAPIHQTPRRTEHVYPSGCSVASFSLFAPLPSSQGTNVPKAHTF